MACVGKVLIIDDDVVVRKSLTKSLSVHYQTLSAVNGEQGVEMVAREQPDIVLLDVEMPGMNGYEVCDKLKHDSATQDIPVVFLSSRSSLRERMLGYEMGGTDFIVKPCDTEELLAKLNSLGISSKQQKKLSQQVVQATATAFSAMKGSSELGLAIQYIESTYLLNSYDSIARKFLEVTGSVDLNCTLIFKTRSGDLFFSSKESVSPLEQELVKTLFTDGRRFIDFGCRTQINYPRVGLLIKNMPLDNPQDYGRYKDFLPTMLGSTDAKIKSLDTEQALIEQTRNITNSFNIVRQTLEQVGGSLRGNQRDVLQLLQGMIGELELRIPTMGLEDDQEKYLISRLDQAIESTRVIIDGGASADNAFQTVCRLLEHLAERQNKLLEEVAATQPEDGQPGHAATEITGEIELF